MTSRLIIFRGNSGCGKTTTAHILREKLGYGTMLVSQDTIRREVIRVGDGPNNPAIELIKRTVLYAKEIDYDVILEGILTKKYYGKMLGDLIDSFEGNVSMFYFKIPFEETLKRHAAKPNAHEFGEKEMREWWQDDDQLGIAGEVIIDADMSQERIVDMVRPKL